MHQSFLCKSCWESYRKPVVMRTPLALPYRLFGLKPSRFNPNTCTACEMYFTQINKGTQITLPATIIFADIRGYTTMSQESGSPEMVKMLTHFYEVAADAIWSRDGVVLKLIGDAVLALFNFPLQRADHSARAVDAALEIQKIGADIRLDAPKGSGREDKQVGIGIGIHTGEVCIGEVGQYCKDLTAIGPVVNLASRIQNAAKPGEVLVTSEVYENVKSKFPSSAMRTHTLKGIEQPVDAYLITA